MKLPDHLFQVNKCYMSLKFNFIDIVNMSISNVNVNIVNVNISMSISNVTVNYNVTVKYQNMSFK